MYRSRGRRKRWVVLPNKPSSPSPIAKSITTNQRHPIPPATQSCGTSQARRQEAPNKSLDTTRETQCTPVHSVCSTGKAYPYSNCFVQAYNKGQTYCCAASTTTSEPRHTNKNPKSTLLLVVRTGLNGGLGSPHWDLYPTLYAFYSWSLERKLP